MIFPPESILDWTVLVLGAYVTLESIDFLLICLLRWARNRPRKTDSTSGKSNPREQMNHFQSNVWLDKSENNAQVDAQARQLPDYPIQLRDKGNLSPCSETKSVEKLPDI